MKNLYLKASEFDTYIIKREEENDFDVHTAKYENGVQYVFQFENGYGASVIKRPCSYGGNEDLWELAVLKFYSNGEYHLNYDTEITEDVEGYLTDEDVHELLKRIKNL